LEIQTTDFVFDQLNEFQQDQIKTKIADRLIQVNSLSQAEIGATKKVVIL